MRFTLTIFLILSPFFVNAIENNNYRFQHITANEGLPNSIIYCITQSRNGFLWIGTNNGLARFDGYEFKIYQPEPYSNNSLTHKAVENILEDNDGRLWLLTQSKVIDCFDPRTGTFYHYPGFSTSIASADRKSTSLIFKDNDGDIWFGSNFGACVFIQKTSSFKYFSHFQQMKIGHVYAMASDQKSNTFLGTEDGLFVVSKKDFSISRLSVKSALDSVAISDIHVDKHSNLWVSTYNNGYYCFWGNKLLIDNKDVKSIHSIFESKNGNIYMMSNTTRKILLFDKNSLLTKKPKSIAIDGDYMTEFFNFSEDSTGNIWYSGSNGLSVINSNNNITNFKNDPSNNVSIAGQNATTLYIDKTNVLWVGIYKSGIDKLDLNQKPFSFITKVNNSKNASIPENNILSVIKTSDNNIWMGTYNSGIVIKSPNGKFRTLKADIQFNSISALFQDKQSVVWAGSFYGGLYKINSKSFQITKIDKNSFPSFKASVIRKIIESKDGDLWIASTSHGLVELKTNENKFYYHSEQNDPNYTDYGFYRTCFEDSRGRIWVGTQSGGAIIFNKDGKIAKHLIHQPNNIHSLISNTIYSFYEDSEGIMWIGTASGLDKYNEATNTFLHYTTQNGLNSNTVYSIIPDQTDMLWINTESGLSIFNKRGEYFKNYTENDGLLSVDFYSTASFKDKDNIFYYGTSRGLLYFDPFQIKENPYPSDPVICGLKIFNKEINPTDKIDRKVILPEDIIYSKKLVLTYQQYLFSLAFTTLNYSASNNVKYQYRLEPFDEGWFLTDYRQRWATYSNLKPGEYKFRVRASNSDGDWIENQKEAVLEIEIMPPFWKTLWFKILSGLMLISGAGLIYYLRLRSYEINRIKLEKLVLERTAMWEDANIALEEQKTEILAQKEKLEINNKLLREQQDRILHQNIELDTHRHHLEQMVEDRTAELKKAREKAEEANRLKSAFLANMSHEIRTPMNAIVGFANLISTNEYSDEQKLEFINIIRRNSESLLVIIDDILDLSKIQSKQLVIVPKAFELKVLLFEIYRSFQVAVESKKLKLQLIDKEIDEKFMLYSDPVRLKQILINLINNAIKFTEDGSITFGINKIEDENICFIVQDTGYGIAPEWHDAIFERFIKVSSIGENHNGAGLGLAISKSLIELLGGRIWFDSEVDKGTNFYFTIPNLNSPVEYKELKSEVNKIELDNFLKGKTILIVEDEEANFKILQAFLKIKKTITVHVNNGLEAVELLKENPKFDAILMDIRMPVMDGITALKQIRELYPSIPIIAQTAYATYEERYEYESYGFNSYLVKPISQSELYQVLYEVITNKK